MPTIRDVAARAGVSISTVSIALAGSGPVSEETRQRVIAAAVEVDYVPNALARSLRSGASRHIALVAGDLTNPFAGSVLRAVERCASGANYTVVVTNSDGDPKRELMALDLLKGQRVAGILLNPVGNGPDYVMKLARLRCPLVLFDQRIDLDRDFIGVDSERASSMLTEYLLRLGHRRIAFIGGRPGLWTADMRLKGFQDTLSAAGLEADPSLCVIGHYRGDAAYRQTVDLLSRQAPPTAILAANNVMALGALQAITDLGFGCPGDISLVSIDDVPWGNLVKPRLTMVTQPVEDLAHTATEWLLERIAESKHGTLPPRSLILPPHLVVGESCRDIRHDQIPFVA
jgi:LacI family transcriptional regulator